MVLSFWKRQDNSQNGPTISQTDLARSNHLYYLLLPHLVECLELHVIR